MKKDLALIIFFKNPVLGKVKTRIGNEVGEEEALNIYKHLYNKVRENIKDFDADKILYYSEQVDCEDDWDNQVFTKKVQRGRDLGERMANAFKEELAEYEKVLLIGTDLPCIDQTMLSKASRALERKHCVVGPCKDGGYFLLGLKEFDSDLFENIQWSTEEVLKETTFRLEQKDKAYCLLSVQNDIDHHKDWLEYIEQGVS